MCTNKLKIIAVTGARSEYDLMYSVYNKLKLDPQFDFSIIITGPHLSNNFGYTAKQIENDNFKISEYIYSFLDSNEKLARVASIGNQIPLLTQTLNREKPDLVMVAGDREEAISVSMTCAYMDVPCLHFFGGDIAKDGNIDNSVRYATSKFAHLHFVTLEQHKQNLIKLGEDDWRIFVIGNPALDRFLSVEKISKKQVLDHFKLDFESDYGVVIQHSIITEASYQDFQIRQTLDAILDTDLVYFLNYPNSDAGSHAIVSVYDEYALKHPDRFIVFKNLDRIIYVNLLKHAKFLIGNSSSGLLEAPSLGLPAINVGERQRGRIHGDNVLFVDNNIQEIKKAINIVLNDNDFLKKVSLKDNPYGDGNSAEKVMSIIKKIKINSKLIYKNISYT
jgi:GDP/UDP-N,N'-diacetylbacillosamine 2-epimerase (hydrolysing)